MLSEKMRREIETGRSNQENETTMKILYKEEKSNKEENKLEAKQKQIR